MPFQAGIFYHASLMDEYRLLTWREFKTKEEAENWCRDWCHENIPEGDDPENPISDLYDTRIQEVE